MSYLYLVACYLIARTARIVPVVGLILALPFFAGSSHAEGVIRLHAHNAQVASGKMADGPMDRAVREAFKRAGIPVEITNSPIRRGMQDIEKGSADGQYPRDRAIGIASDEVVPLPITLYRSKFVAFTNSQNLEFKGRDSLRKLRVAYLAGWRIFERQRFSYGEFHFTRKMENLMGMVERQRVDIGLLEKRLLQMLMGENDLGHFRILEPPVEVLDLTLLLHHKHRALVPRLTRAFQDMISDGTMKRLCPACVG